GGDAELGFDMGLEVVAGFEVPMGSEGCPRRGAVFGGRRGTLMRGGAEAESFERLPQQFVEKDVAGDWSKSVDRWQVVSTQTYGSQMVMEEEEELVVVD
ncbi:hypothetical protein H0H87_005707, partial [Tephrocybe sp. NHM501043]